MKLVLLALVLGVSSHAAQPPVTFYSSDPSHLWNRLYAALLVRSTADGVVHDDLLDPPLWWQTKHLLDGETNRRAVTLLGEFSLDHESLAAMSPIQRALMQRDLLGVFCWLTAGSGVAARSPVAEHRSFAAALARAIRHVALRKEEIGRLPDNYATAVARPEAPTSFLPEDPGRPFLPADLLITDGPWIAVESQDDDWLPATVHFKALHGRSAFKMFFRHPEGRAAGEAYLATLAAMPNPWVSEKPERVLNIMPNRNPDLGPWVNPATPTVSCRLDVGAVASRSARQP